MIIGRPSWRSFLCVYRFTLRVAQVKTEHRKGEPSKTTCREICRYYINGKGQCEVMGFEDGRHSRTGAPLGPWDALLAKERLQG